MVPARALQQAVCDLQTTRPGPGLRKTAVSAAVTLPLMAVALTAADWRLAAASGVAAGLAFASWLITTHDALHHTLTGWRWFDELLPRLLSWPLLWVHGMYAEVHKLHHKMNGDDLDDPERVQWTRAEYAAAGPLGRLYVRHQALLDVLVLGGIGLIVSTGRQALRLYPKSRAIRRQVWLDVVGIAGCNIGVYAVAAAHGAALRYFLLWVLMERIGGGVLQWRGHVEHYGLWGKGRHYFETQVYNCRNLRSSRLGSWFFNRLNYHSVHHAFPRVPFYQLAVAHQRVRELYTAADGERLVEEESYLQTLLRIVRAPTLIGPVDPASPSGRRLMTPVGSIRQSAGLPASATADGLP